MERKDNISSCIMIAANLITPVSLASIFETEDLKDSGITFDSHITLLYADGLELSKGEVMDCIEGVSVRSEALQHPGPNAFIDYLKELSNHRVVRVLDLFDLSNFENDSGYVVLKLKKDSEWFNILAELNQGLKEEFGVKTTFKDYTPHITLAELKPGTTGKYINSKTLQAVLRESKVRLEDLTLSVSQKGDVDYDVTNLTINRAVDRYFRERYLRQLASEL